LENKTTAHNFNETSRSSSNVETSEFDFLESGEQDNNACQTLPDDLSKKVNKMIQPSQNFQFILGDIMEMIKLLNADFKHLFILNIRGLNIQLKRMP